MNTLKTTTALAAILALYAVASTMDYHTATDHRTTYQVATGATGSDEVTTAQAERDMAVELAERAVALAETYAAECGPVPAPLYTQQ